jgi:hypothetical protein
MSFNSLRDGQGSKTALPIWGEFVKKLQADPQYNSYFNSWWPEEYRWINDCPFMMEEDGLEEFGTDPSMEGDSTYMGPRKYKIEEPPTGIGKIIDDIFGKKKEKEKDDKEEE